MSNEQKKDYKTMWDDLKFHKQVYYETNITMYKLEDDPKYNITPDIEFEAYEPQAVSITGKEIVLEKGDKIIIVRAK